MLLMPERKPGTADVSDLRHNDIVAWQHKHYFLIALVTGLFIPVSVAGWLWGDWRGGLFYAGMCRITFVHHVSVSFSDCVWCLFGGRQAWRAARRRMRRVLSAER